MDHHRQAGTELQFIAHPTTWLNQGRWDDELVQPSTQAAGTAVSGSVGNPEEFAWKSLTVYRMALQAAGLKQLDEIKLKAQAISIAGGGSQALGVGAGPQLEPGDVVELVRNLDRSAVA